MELIGELGAIPHVRPQSTRQHVFDGGEIAQGLLLGGTGTGNWGGQLIAKMGMAVAQVDADPVRSRQIGIPPGVVPIGPIDIEHQGANVRRRVVLDMAIGQCSGLRADQQPLRRIIGAVGSVRQSF